jgi:hypothetical protein
VKADDYKAFAELLIKMWRVSSNGRNGKLPDDGIIEFYFAALQDVTLEQIRQNGLLHFRKNKGGWFPSVAELLQGEDVEALALMDYQYLSDVMDSFCGFGFGLASQRAIEIKLEKDGKQHLKPMLMQFHREIISNDNPTATRAQFLKAYKHQAEYEQNKNLLQPPEQIAGLLGGLTKKLKA